MYLHRHNTNCHTPHFSPHYTSLKDLAQASQHMYMSTHTYRGLVYTRDTGKVFHNRRQIFTLFRCPMESGDWRWYISIVPETSKPGTSDDIDYYFAPSLCRTRDGRVYDADNDEVPPKTNWQCIKQNHAPAPILYFEGEEEDEDDEVDDDQMDDDDDLDDDLQGMDDETDVLNVTRVVGIGLGRRHRHGHSHNSSPNVSPQSDNGMTRTPPHQQTPSPHRPPPYRHSQDYNGGEDGDDGSGSL